jgi:DNA-binding NtrC family response regulator
MPYSTYRTVCSEDHECYILAVDDETYILDILKLVFASQKNITLLTASTKEDALSIIYSTPHLEAVLLDMKLGLNDPMETLRDIVKATDRRITVIGISGDHLLEDEAMKNGANDFWGKPLNEIDIIGRTKFNISNQRKTNYWRDRCKHYESRLEVIEGDVKTDPDKALEELETTRLELKADVQALMMRAN